MKDDPISSTTKLKQVRYTDGTYSREVEEVRTRRSQARFADLVDRDRGRLEMVAEIDCREAIAAFMLDWNQFPAEQCAWRMFDRLKKLAAENSAILHRVRINRDAG